MITFNKNVYSIFNGETGFTILDQHTTSCSITLVANRIFSREEGNDPAGHLYSQLTALGLHYFEVLFKGENQFQIIDINAFEKGIDAWATQEGENADWAATLIKLAFELKQTELKLNQFELKSLPPEIGMLSHLEKIDVSVNQLTQLPETLGYLVNLKEIRAYKNQLESLPDVMTDLPKLEIIDVSDNLLSSLPGTIGKSLNLKKINVQNNRLESVPDTITHLSHLEELDLSSNQLSLLPETMGKLVNLNALYISDNELSLLPESIGNLLHLETLDAYKNRLGYLPNTIGALAKLKNFSLRENEITYLPEAIGNLESLTNFDVSENSLTYLPSQMGQLTKLRELDISFNNLSAIPFSVGECINLTSLICDCTNLSEEHVQSICDMCEAKRNQQAMEGFLNTRLQAWQLFSEKEFNFQFIDEAEDKEKCIINEWLTRLERTKDFNTTSQKELANVACHMLASLSHSLAFKEIFMTQVPLNLVQCGDRAAMAFNELFLAWRLDALDSQTSKKEKLDLIISASKTTALRCALQNRIQLKEREQKQAAEKRCVAEEIPLLDGMWQIGEGVEIYLYYETTLKERLNLLTFMNGMLYSPMGRCDWIDEASLIQEVEKSYLECMIDLSPLIAMRNEDESYTSMWKMYQQNFAEQMEQLERSQAEVISEQFYKEEMDKIKRDAETMQRNLTREWLAQLLQLYNFK